MFISAAGPRVVLYGPDGQAFALYHRDAQDPCGYAMASSNEFDIWGALRPRHQQNHQQHSVVSDEPWFPKPDEHFVMEDPHAPCLSGGNALPYALKPDPAAPSASLSAPRSVQLYAAGRTMEGESFWSTPPAQGTFPSPISQAVITHWQTFQDAQDIYGEFGIGPSAHGLPNCGLGPTSLPPESMLIPHGPMEQPLSNADPQSLYGSFSSAGASDMMESMVLDDGPVSSSPWSASANEAGFCVPAFTVDSPPWPGAVSHLEATVSPKLLRIVPTPTPTSSTDSVHTTFFTGEGDPDSHFLPFGPPPLGQHAPQALAHPPPMAKPHQQSKNRRRQLPDRAPQPRQKTPTSPAMAKAKSRQVVRSGQASITSPAPKLEPRPAHMPPSYVANTPVDNRSKTRKDEFLINSKMSGMTYKEIKRVGKFAEAESTLRGRFRTLTKNKEARVRKPGWEEKDDQLLRRAVQELEKGGKIPWKLVAEYIVRNGGSYHFGNTTCRKRWDLLIDEDGDML